MSPIHKVWVTRHCTTVFIAFYVMFFRLTNSQSVVSCSQMKTVQINETDPAGIVLFRYEVRPNANVKMQLADATSLPPSLKKIYEHALAFDPYESSNTLKCSFDASRSQNGISFCDVKIATMLDAEGINAKAGYPPASPESRSFILSFDVTCRDNIGRYMRNSNHLVVHLVNEFTPVFKNKTVSRNVLLMDLVKGYELFDLTGQVTDQDIGLDGKFGYHTVQGSNHSDLIAVTHRTNKVVLLKNITLEYLEGRRQLSFRIAATDLGRPTRSSYMTLQINVFDTDDDDGNSTVFVYNITFTDMNSTASVAASHFPTWALITGPIGIAALLGTGVLVCCHYGWLSRRKEKKGTGSEKAGVADKQVPGGQGRESVTGVMSGFQESESQPGVYTPATRSGVQEYESQSRVTEDLSTVQSTGAEESGTSEADFSTTEVTDDGESVI